jgi:hypothetical protein
LIAIHVIFVPVHGLKQRLFSVRATAGIDAVAQCRHHWLPTPAYEKGGERGFDGGAPASGLGIAWRNSVPDTQLLRLSCPLIPHHHREQHTHTTAMEVRNHLSHARNAARHAENQVMLIPVVDPIFGWVGQISTESIPPYRL